MGRVLAAVGRELVVLRRGLRVIRALARVRLCGVARWTQPCFLLQHHPRWLWRGPLLPGPVARRPGQALQLWRPGDLDADRRLAHWGRLRGASGRLFVHLAVAVRFAGEPSREGLGGWGPWGRESRVRTLLCTASVLRLP